MKTTVEVKQTTVPTAAPVYVPLPRDPTKKQKMIAAKMRQMDDVTLSEFFEMQNAAHSYWMAWKTAADEADYSRSVLSFIKEKVTQVKVGYSKQISTLIDDTFDMFGIKQENNKKTQTQ
jgi:hypothetical protein